jgi:hypothetical protein
MMHHGRLLLEQDCFGSHIAASLAAFGSQHYPKVVLAKAMGLPSGKVLA